MSELIPARWGGSERRLPPPYVTNPGISSVFKSNPPFSGHLVSVRKLDTTQGPGHKWTHKQAEERDTFNGFCGYKLAHRRTQLLGE